MPWIIDEDRALKDKLSNIVISNYSDGREITVPAFFRYPDPEERTRTFPHISIDMTSIDYDPTRAHRANAYIQPFDLEQATPPSGFFLIANDMPLPWSIEYQISMYSRQPWHDRQLTAWMYQLFPEQYGFLDLSNYDGTTRRADLVSVVRRDTVDAERKRLYRNIFTIAVSSEMYVYQLQAISQILSVAVDVEFTVDFPVSIPS